MNLQHAKLTCYSQPEASTLIQTAGQLFRKCDDSDRVGLKCYLVQIKTGSRRRPNKSCKQDESTVFELQENIDFKDGRALLNNASIPSCCRSVTPITPM